MAYFHCRTRIRIRTRIPVLCRIFPLVQIRTLIPWLKGIRIWVWVSGNMFCITLCSHRVWNPSPSLSLNPTPAVKISHNTYFCMVNNVHSPFGTFIEVCLMTFYISLIAIFEHWLYPIRCFREICIGIYWTLHITVYFMSYLHLKVRVSSSATAAHASVWMRPWGPFTPTVSVPVSVTVTVKYRLTDRMGSELNLSIK